MSLPHTLPPCELNATLPTAPSALLFIASPTTATPPASLAPVSPPFSPTSFPSTLPRRNFVDLFRNAVEVLFREAVLARVGRRHVVKLSKSRTCLFLQSSPRGHPAPLKKWPHTGAFSLT
eukprot:c17533_g2_i3.p1 GENE.c17533_g2_i3~~c17533_g2_i3.p1  ORF type:complete len:120 (-),score=15.14 c17533_g2_i3:196-555(-)